MRVFLSYRRSDVGGYAGRLTDVLVQRLGAKNVFQDVIAIAPGTDFTLAIDRALDSCDAVLAVIGPGWLSVTSPDGERRLTEADDFVRRELAMALARDAVVIPVLVGGATLPSGTDLPVDLQGLARRQGVVLRDQTWHQDVDGLLRSLRGDLPVPSKPRRRRLLAIVPVLVLVAAGTVIWQRGHDNPGSDTVSLPKCATTAGPSWTRVRLKGSPSASAVVDTGSLTFTVTSARWKPISARRWQVTLTTAMLNSSQTSQSNASYHYEYLAVGRRENNVTCFDAPEGGVDRGSIGDATVGFEVGCKPVGYLKLRVHGDDDMFGSIDLTAPTSSTAC